MEHISEILKRQTAPNSNARDTGTWSGAEQQKGPEDTGCPACNGAGFVHPLLSSGKPDYSQVVPCRCAREKQEKQKQSDLLRYSNLGSLTRFTFDELSPGRSGDPAIQSQFKRAYEAARAFVDEPRGWLVFTGPSGCGKTHLAAAIANERIRHDKPTFFQSVPDLLDHLRSAFAPGSEMTYDELFERVSNAPLLVLDDLGAQSSTPWAKEKLHQLLNHRFNSELPTVITSITPVEEMDDRIRTRLMDTRLSRIYVIEEKASGLAEYGWGPGFELQKSMTFSNFDAKRVNLPPEQRQNLEMAYHTVLGFAQEPDGWLVLQGEHGCGKTHLASAIANYQYEAKKPALFIVVPDFLDHLRGAFSPDSKISYDRFFERVKNAPLLILDDFGEQSTTLWAREKLYQVINHRYNARLATVITTSLSLDEIESRIASRLIDPKMGVFFNIKAPDYRSDMKSGQSVPKTPPRRPRRM